MNGYILLKHAIRIGLATGIILFLSYKPEYTDVGYVLACTTAVGKTDQKLDASTAGSVNNTTTTEKTVQTAANSASFSDKFEALGSKPTAMGKITVDVTSLDAKQMVSDDSRMENPLNKKFKISTSFANDQTVTNASTNVNMFVRLHNKFFSTNFVGFDLLNKKSYVAQFTHMVNA